MFMACEDDSELPFQTYTIPAGAHSGTIKAAALSSTELVSTVIFDESAIYTTANPENQWDTNKLIGFSDCNSHHHQNSARFGWRWTDNLLEIIAYCYVDGERVIRKIGEVNINEENTYRLRLEKDAYVFQINNQVPYTVKRENDCDKGFYYMLWPYFGGQEVAPHNISIKMRIENM